MIGIKISSMIRVPSFVLLTLLFTFFQSNDIRAEDSCVSCHTDVEKLTNSLGKEDKAKSSLQSGPG